MSNKNIHVERLKRLACRSSEAWQGGFVPLPAYVRNDEGKPYRPIALMWASSRTGLAHVEDIYEPGTESFADTLVALTAFAEDEELAGYCPGRLEVKDPDLAEWLRSTLEGTAIEVACREQLPALEEAADYITQGMWEEEQPPGPLDGKGVTLERFEPFADACRLFYEAAPWQDLSNEDLIRVETPQAPSALEYAAVMGGGEQEYGLSFFHSRAQFWDNLRMDSFEDFLESIEVLWSLTFEHGAVIPPAESQLWDEYDLPLAAPKAYPLFVGFRPQKSIKRADKKMLTYVEGLLRALAGSTEGELDSGKWRKEVETYDGEVTYRLRLPLLLDPPDVAETMEIRELADQRVMERPLAQVERFIDEHESRSEEELEELVNEKFAGRDIDETIEPPRTPLEEAQDICYEAFGALGRRQIVLAKQALDICPDCADAYVILADKAPDAEGAMEYYRKGAEAGRRALGDMIEEAPDLFWKRTKTRPYMRALFGLAGCQKRLGYTEEAVENCRELLRLNPDDNQGVRFYLLPLLIEEGRDEEAWELLEQYRDETEALWAYCRALLLFREKGDSKQSRQALSEAMEVNPHVYSYLVGEKEPSYIPQGYRPGGESEAIVCVMKSWKAWVSTEGALEWFEEHGGRG